LAGFCGLSHNLPIPDTEPKTHLKESAWWKVEAHSFEGNIFEETVNDLKIELGVFYVAIQ